MKFFKNKKNKLCKWQFIGLAECLTTGNEIFEMSIDYFSLKDRDSFDFNFFRTLYPLNEVFLQNGFLEETTLVCAKQKIRDFLEWTFVYEEKKMHNREIIYWDIAHKALQMPPDKIFICNLQPSIFLGSSGIVHEIIILLKKNQGIVLRMQGFA
jgi:hypothetical protein